MCQYSVNPPCFTICSASTMSARYMMYPYYVDRPCLSTWCDRTMSARLATLTYTARYSGKYDIIPYIRSSQHYLPYRTMSAHIASLYDVHVLCRYALLRYTMSTRLCRHASHRLWCARTMWKRLATLNNVPVLCRHASNRYTMPTLHSSLYDVSVLCP